MRKITQFILTQVRWLISQPTEELTRLQKTLQYAVDLTRHCTQQLRRDRATQMAAALTYRTIFSLVPMLIMSLLIFRTFVSLEEAQTQLQDQMYSFFDFSSIQLQAAGVGDENVAATIQEQLSTFVANGYRLNMASVGGIGLLLLAWAAMGFIVTIEQCFNHVFNCRAGRTWGRRIFLYWTVLTLGPVVMMVSLYITERLIGQATQLPVVGALFQMLSSFTAVGASWLLLMLLYTLMPNTPVKLRPAAIGALVAAVLWELGKVGFKYYATQAVTFSALYGSLGLILLFLFWLYLTWLVILFGLELTYALQSMAGRQLQSQTKIDERDLITDARLILPIMAAIGRAFEQGGAIPADKLAQQLHLPIPIATQFCQHLQDAGMIHPLDKGGYVLARPAEQIQLDDLLKLARSMTHDSQQDRFTPGRTLLEELDAAEAQVAGGRSLAQVLAKVSKSEDFNEPRP